jgi:hypothetical protein
MTTPGQRLHQTLVQLTIEGGGVRPHEAILQRLSAGRGRPGGERQERQGSGTGLNEVPAAAAPVT